MIEYYMKHRAPQIQPAYVEWSFDIPMHSAGINIHGFIDLITEDGMIIDHKNAGTTTRRDRTQNKVDNNFQLTMYSLAFRKTFGKPEKGVGIDVLKRLKS